MRFVNRIFYVSLIASVQLNCLAHGIHETNEQANHNVDKPFSWLDFFISDLNARASIRIDEQGGYRYIDSDGLANHNTGQFPNPNNPNAIQEQQYKFKTRLNPQKASLREVGHNSFGVAINGVPFDPATAEYWNNDRSSDWNIDALSGNRNLGIDNNNAHVQPNGAYHYHGLPTGLVNQYLYKSNPVLIGYAADGFPIYSSFGYSDSDDANSTVKELKSSYRVKQGTRPDGPGGSYDGTYTRDWEYVSGLGDLDECNGREGITPEYPDGTYYYVITNDYPNVPRCWVGEPDSSFFKGPGSGRGASGGQRPDRGRSSEPGDRRGPPPGGGGPGGSRRPPQEAISACQGKSDGASCTVQTPHGNLTGTCRTMGSDKACVPSRR